MAEVVGIHVLGARKVPVISWASAGDWEEAVEYPEEWVVVLSTSPRLFALRVHGDSMEPEFVEGDIIVVDPERIAQPGDFVLVRKGHGEVMFKQLKTYGDKSILRPLNPRYPEIEMTEEHEIIGVVGQKILIRSIETFAKACMKSSIVCSFRSFKSTYQISCLKNPSGGKFRLSFGQIHALEPVSFAFSPPVPSCGHSEPWETPLRGLRPGPIASSASGG